MHNLGPFLVPPEIRIAVHEFRWNLVFSVCVLFKSLLCKKATLFTNESRSQKMRPFCQMNIFRLQLKCSTC